MRFTGVNYFDGGVTVRDASVIDANQSADAVNASGNETISRTVFNDAAANSSKRAGSPVSGGPNACSHQSNIRYRAPRTENSEQTDRGRPTNVQIRDCVASAIKDSIKGAAFTYRNPPVAAVPIDITLVRFAIPIGVKVQIGCQLISGATCNRAHRTGVRIVKGRRIVSIARNAIAVQVPPNSIKLRQVVYFDQTVTVSVTR